MNTAIGDRTLLDKAVAARHVRVNTPSDQMLELALAYVNGQITCGQASRALGHTRSTGNTLTRMASALISAARRGVVRIERVAGEKA